MRLWPAGTILVPKSGASTVLNNRVRLAEPAYASSHLATVQARPGTDDAFLYHALCHLDARLLMGNAGYPSVSLADLGAAPIAVPPLHEQKSIAKTLDSVDHAITTTSADLTTTSQLYDALSARFLTPSGSDFTSGDWKRLTVSSVTVPLRFDRTKQIPKSMYTTVGRWPVYDQSPAAPAAFTDDSDRLIAHPGPVIIFGDHTKTVHYVTSPFALGAEGTKPLLVHHESSARFVFHALRHLRVPGSGYRRYYSVLRDQRLFIPTRSVQDQIAHILDAVLETCAALRAVTRQIEVLYRSLLNRLIPN